MKRILVTAIAFFQLHTVAAQEAVIKTALNEPVSRVYACFENRCRIEVKDRYGFCDSTGKICIKPVYEETSRFVNGYCLVKSEGKNYYINKEGKPLQDGKYGYLDPVSPGLFAYTDETTGLKGILDASGKELAKPQWKSVDRLNVKENLIRVQDSKSLYGFLNTRLEQVIPCEYDLTGNFENGIAKVSKGSFGLISKTNKVLVPFEYDNIYLMKGKCLLETRNKPYKIYDIPTGKIAETGIDYYSSVNVFNVNYKILPSGKGKYALYNSQLKKLFEMDNDDCRLTSDELGIVAFKKNDYWGLYNANGKVIHEPVYDRLSFYQNGLLAVKKGDLYGFVDTSGRLVIPLQFTSADDFYESQTGVVYKGAGILIRKGKMGELPDLVLIKPKQPVDKIYECVNNRCGVRVGDKIGFIDTTGKLVIKPEFDYIDDFKNGYARVTKGNLKYYINVKGEPLTRPGYGYLTPEGDRYFSYTDTVKKLDGLLDAGGKPLCPAKWKFIGFLEGSAGLFKARDAVTGKAGIVNVKMETVIPFEYDGFGAMEMEALIIAEKSDGKNTRKGVIDVKNAIVVPFEYDRIYPMKDNFLLERIGQPYRALRLSDAKIWETNIRWYMQLNRNSRNYKIAQDASLQLNLYNSRLGVQYKITEDEAIIADDSNGLIAVARKGLWGLRNAEGKMILEPQFDDIGYFNNGLAVVRSGNMYGIIDVNGIRKIPLQFDYFANMLSLYTGVTYRGETQLLHFTGKLSGPVVVSKAEKISAAIHADSMLLVNIKRTVEEFKNLNKSLTKAMDGSAKGPDNTVTSLAITYNQEIKNAFLRGMKYAKMAKDTLQIIDEYLLADQCDNITKITEVKGKINSALVNILFEQDYLRSYLNSMDIEYTNRTTYQLWTDNVEAFRKRYVERMANYIDSLESSGVTFQKEINACLKMRADRKK